MNSWRMEFQAVIIYLHVPVIDYTDYHSWLTVVLGEGDFDLAVDPEPAVVPGEDDAQGERGVDQRVVEVVLSSNCRSFLEIDLWML